MAISDILHTVGTIAQPIAIGTFAGSLISAGVRFWFSRDLSAVQNIRIGLGRSQPLPTVVASAHQRWSDIPKTNDDRAIEALKVRADKEERGRIAQEKTVGTTFTILVTLMVLSGAAWAAAIFIKPG